MYKTGMIPSPQDKRDYQFSTYNKPHGLPVRFERPVVHLKDQGSLGACVGFGASYMRDEQEIRDHPGRGYETSPLYIYKKCKERDGIPNQEGTYPRVANEVMLKEGVCLEKTYPYSDAKPIRPIPGDADTEADKFRIKSYTSLNAVHEIKQAIHDHGYVLAGFMILSSFLNPEITDKGAFVPEPNMYILGGHAVSIIGYDDGLTHTYKDGKTYTGFIKIVNSWRDETGKWWGKEGTAWIPYDLLYRDIAGDLPGMTFLMEAWSTQDEVTPDELVEHIRLKIGSKEALVDGEKVQLDQAPVIDPDSWRTMVPVSFISQTLGFDVTWHPQTQEIDIKRRG